MRTPWIAVFVLLDGTVLAGGSPPIPDGPQFQVNSVTTYLQSVPAVSRAENGNFVVAWASETSEGTEPIGFSIQLQRFGALGLPEGPQFQVNTYTTGVQYQPAVSMTQNDGFVVTWRSDGSFGNDMSGLSIQGQRYSPDGIPIGTQFQVNSYRTGDQVSSSVSHAEGGTFVVVWDSSWSEYGQEVWSVQAQRYAADGTPVEQQFQVAGYPFSPGHHYRPKVAAASDGTFVVVWTAYVPDSSSQINAVDDFGVLARQFYADGTPVGLQFQVNTYTTGAQQLPAVALSDWGFVVAWDSDGSAGSDSSGYSIQARRFAADGSSMGPQFQVNSYTLNDQRFPGVGISEDGGFVVTWMSDGSPGADTSRLSIQGQRFAADGRPLGKQFEINTYTTSVQAWPAVAGDSRGDFVVAWTSYGSNYGDTSYSSIQGQRYQVRIFLDGFETGTTEAWSMAVP